MSLRLSTNILPQITTATPPAYDRNTITCGIVHLGIGGFHRAHQAVYTDALLASGDMRWGITGVSFRSNDVREALAQQDYLYTVQTLDAQSGPSKIIGSVMTSLAIRETGHLAQVLELLANPNTHVVTLTITEKGYCANHAGELDSAHPDIAHDLSNPETPCSAPGLLALGLSLRMKNGAGPITILSCDNLSGNGRVTRNVVTAMVHQLNSELADWLAGNVSFPSSMVDRIVPQTSKTDVAAFEATAGYRDLALTRAEAFSQWVIEDSFAGERPSWDMAGALFVADVAPFEQAKLRLLNATHSALAYLGLLAGYSYVHEAIADPALQRFVQQLLDNEIAPEVISPTGMDLTEYTTSILERFTNAAVPYTTLQVASDGSLKLPQRIFPTVVDRLNSQRSINSLCLVTAAWIKCLIGQTDDTTAISVNDPAATEIARLFTQHSAAPDLIQAIAEKTDYFGNLAKNPLFIETLSTALTNLRRDGSLKSAELYANYADSP